MRASEIRRSYLEFFQARGHSHITRANLVPKEDPTTLFTGSGMQPLIPYLLGAPHPQGTRLVDSQPCFRAEDIDEVGDARHTTFFEMLGNWSLGDYFKAEQLRWLFAFLTTGLGLDPERLFATAFAGSGPLGIPRDDESVSLWRELFAGAGVSNQVAEVGTAGQASDRGTGGARIVLYDESQCWWSRSGVPANMPVGEPGGPDSEVFYLFPQVEHDAAFGAACHPHCDCGRFVEIGNSVFMEYRRAAEGFEPLPQTNVDFGGGLERLAMAAADTSEVFDVDLLAPVLSAVASLSGRHDPDRRALRIVADHARAVTFLAVDGVEPSNNTQGYAMRRFARRALRQGLHLGIESGLLPALVGPLVEIYGDAYPELSQRAEAVRMVLDREEGLFRRTLARGVRELPPVGRGASGRSGHLHPLRHLRLSSRAERRGGRGVRHRRRSRLAGVLRRPDGRAARALPYSRGRHVQGRPVRPLRGHDPIAHRHPPALQGPPARAGRPRRAARQQHHPGATPVRLLPSGQDDPGAGGRGRGDRERQHRARLADGSGGDDPR
ncbi:MAG TPA: alanine--tRNA ligase-related protein [Acidimicrobiales bacterium]|nr:alanine--tRNA ligase-related protein [Acidimicrobiales bacterium]